MKYIIIEKTRQGWKIKDSITNNTIHYIHGYSMREAERKHRENNGLKGKHLQKIII
jgi:hypothetical protein